jgi:hypothetical protein
LAIHDRGDVESGACQPLPPGLLLLVAGCAPGDVVDGAGAPPASLAIRPVDDLDQPAWSRPRDLEAEAGTVFLLQAEAERFTEQGYGVIYIVSSLVAIVEVIGARIVKVDGQLDQAETEYVRIKVHVSLRIAGYGCDMVYTRDALRVHS